MAINKKLIHFKKKENFIAAVVDPSTPSSGSEETKDAVYGQLLGTSIVFIGDSQEIWTHGKLYNGSVTLDAIAEAIAEHNTDESAHETISAAATEANEIAYEFAQVAQEAKTTAEAAKNSIASLEGLADADTSALTVAELVTKIETNTANIDYLLDRDIIISQSDFDALESKDVTKHYFIYEDV